MSVTVTSRQLKRACAILVVLVVALGTLHTSRAAAVTRASAARGADLSVSRNLSGFSSQNWPVISTVTSKGKRISVAAALVMTCSLGDNYTAEDAWAKLPVAANGKVHRATAVAPIPASGNFEAITGGSRSISGKLNRTRGTFSGAMELHLNYQTSNGQADSCDSGRASFTLYL